MISYVQFNHHTQPPTCSNKTTGSMWLIREAWEVSWKEIPASPTTRATCALSRPNDKCLQLQIGLRPWNPGSAKSTAVKTDSRSVSTCLNLFQQIQLVPGFFPDISCQTDVSLLGWAPQASARCSMCSLMVNSPLKPCCNSFNPRTYHWRKLSWLHMGFRMF